MNSILRRKNRSPSAVNLAGLTAVRMRFPNRLPTLIPTHSWSRRLQRLLWLFGGH